MVTLLAAAAAARAEDHAQPVPAGGGCAVDADKRWTTQEKLVWAHVCRGEIADFNHEAGYGGSLDPKAPKEWPAGRILTSSFLETILLKDKYRQALTRRGVRIIGARFTERLDLQIAELRHELWLAGSLLEKGASLYGLRSTRRIIFANSKLGEDLDMRRLKVDEDVSIEDTELGKLDMDSAHVGGLSLSRSKFAGVILAAAHIDGPLDLTGAKVGEKLKLGTLNMEGIQIADDLFMDEAEVGDVDMKDGHVRGKLSLNRAMVRGKLDMQGVQIDQGLFMRNSQFVEVSLLSAHIGGEL
ncbi:MAG TPA: hypothetical protein VJ487_19835, partial [Alphaproteobacteria bacterium]|nr:hypothetical protein [Alphaproteobacteria bacterium]